MTSKSDFDNLAVGDKIRRYFGPKRLVFGRRNSMQWFLANLNIYNAKAKLVSYQLARSNMIGSSCIDATSSLPTLLDLLTSLSVVVEPKDNQKIMDLKAQWMRQVPLRCEHCGQITNSRLS